MVKQVEHWTEAVRERPSGVGSNPAGFAKLCPLPPPPTNIVSVVN